MTPYSLRPADDADRNRIAEIWHMSAGLPNVGPPVMPSYETLRSRVDEELDLGWDVTVVETGDDIIGFLAIKPKEKVLAELFLSPKFIGRGIGKALLDCAKGTMAEGFTLYTTSRNLRARAFYEREGMIALREEPHPRSGHPVTYYQWFGS